MSANVQLTAWCPSSDLAQSLGSDGSDGDAKFRWNGIAAKGKLTDGEGNEIDITEAIQILLALKAANNG